MVAEIALSLMLLVSAGLLLKDFARLRSVDIGVRRDGVWTAAVQLPEAHYKTDRQQYDFSQALSERLRRIGGVDSVALSDNTHGWSKTFINEEEERLFTGFRKQKR